MNQREWLHLAGIFLIVEAAASIYLSPLNMDWNGIPIFQLGRVIRIIIGFVLLTSKGLVR